VFALLLELIHFTEDIEEEFVGGVCLLKKLGAGCRGTFDEF
jgi:hypothetical protein